MCTWVVIAYDDEEQNGHLTEFLNGLCNSGLPPHRLLLKEASIMLIRHLNISKELINWTRLRFKHMHSNILDCEELTGASVKERVLVLKVHLQLSDNVLVFKLQRTQFPVISAFAITINKAQGKSSATVWIYLPRPLFSHGHCNVRVAASHARSFRALVENAQDHGEVLNDHKILTQNYSMQGVNMIQTVFYRYKL